MHDEMVKAHATADEAEIARLHGLSEGDRAQMLEAACVTAAEIERSRLAAGMPPRQPEPWPESTWEFRKRHAARFRD